MFWQNRQRVTPEGWLTPNHRTFNDWFVTTDHYRKIKNKPDKMANAWREFQSMLMMNWMGGMGGDTRKQKPFTGFAGYGGGAGGLTAIGPKQPSLQDQLANFYMSYPLLSDLNVSPFTAPTDAGGATYNPAAPSSTSNSLPGMTTRLGSPSPNPSVPADLGGPAPAMYYQPDSFPNSYYNNNQHGVQLQYNSTASNWNLDQDMTVDMIFYLNLTALGLNSKAFTWSHQNQGIYIEALPGPNPKSLEWGANPGAGNRASSPTNQPSYKTWHYARISKQNGGKWGMSLDGHDYDYGASNATSDTDNNLWLGCYSHNFYCWVGWLGYLRIYNDFRDPVNPADYESVLFG